MGKRLFLSVKVNDLPTSPPSGGWFSGRDLVIATRHGKERVIATALESTLGLRCQVPADLDTDALGTFTGERPRTGSPLDAARAKCDLAYAATGADLLLASEGSFGPHPTIYFVPADEELLLVQDRLHGWEFIVSHLSTEVNFAGRELVSLSALWEFAQSVGFPEHAMVLRPSKDASHGIVKGLCDRDSLEAAAKSLMERYGRFWAETDMRAMHNPTRMRVIAEAAALLAQKMGSNCPACSVPGYGVTEKLPGLPCMACGSPTRSTLMHVLACQCCGHSEEIPHPHGRGSEDPRWCDWCNP